jgi:hypothetical protein
MHRDGSHLGVHIYTALVVGALVGAWSSDRDPIPGAGDVAPFTLTRLRFNK